MLNIKSEREIGLMRKAGLLVWQAHQIVAGMVRPGTTTAEMDRAVEEFFLKYHAVPLFKNYPHNNADKPAFPAVTCMSRNDAVVHGIPDDLPLVEGDIISVDTGCRIDGWCGDAAVTHAVGKISPEDRKLLDVTRGVLALAVDLMQSKQMWSEVAVEMESYVADHGLATVECFVGHGIGRQMHEDPQVPNFLNRSLRGSGDFRIEPGLVIAIEPMVNVGTKRVKMLPDQWTQATKDGSNSAHFEHTVAVTAAGPRCLTGPPTAIEIAAFEVPLEREPAVVW